MLFWFFGWYFKIVKLKSCLFCFCSQNVPVLFCRSIKGNLSPSELLVLFGCSCVNPFKRAADVCVSWRTMNKWF